MIGQVLGPYQVLSKIGEGGMGEVYRARDTRLGREVAVKVLPASVAGDADRRARFEREAKAVAALSHPNILAIFEFGHADGTAYVVTELLEGETLRRRLMAPIPIRKAIEIATQIARGLAAAHDKGIVHRDLKPENVFILADGQVKILDFGLAKTTADGSGHESETVAGTDPGTVLGTVGYMAPEQIRGHAVDARTDLFALGAVMHEMVAGRRTFERETAAETMTAILKEDPPDLCATRPDVPPALESIVRHCLERSPTERFQSARDLIFNLQSAATSSGSGSTSGVTVAERSRAALGTREMIGWGLAAVLALTSIATLVLVRNRGPAEGTPGAVARFQVSAPDKTTWGAPFGSPDGSNGGTISPDGTTLAFVSGDATGKALLWVRPIDSFAARALPGTEDAAFPFWSPDSRYVAYFVTGRLLKIRIDGGPVQTITEMVSTPRGGTWNRDGVILFATAGSVILRVSADGGQPAPVAAPDAASTGQMWPWFLPDGKHFLFYGPNTRQVYVASLDGGPIKSLLASDTNAVFAAPDQILFVRENALFAQRFDLAKLEPIGDPAAVVQNVSWNIPPWNQGAFSASSNGALTYRLNGGNRSQLAWFNRAGDRLGIVGPPGDYLSPALSPDESKVAFMRRDNQPAGDIWIFDLARSTPARMTISPKTDVYPVWSNDGSAITYYSLQEGIMSANVGSSDSKQLFPTSSLVVPTQITPDGKSILFFADFNTATGFDIFLRPLTGDVKPTPIVQGPFNDVECRISLDGKWLAYASADTGRYEVYVEPFPPNGERRPISAGGGRQPMWNSNGRELFYVTDKGQLYVVEIQPGASFSAGSPRFLFNMPSNTLSVRNSYEPSRDGQRFLVNVLLDAASPPIYVDTDWASTVKR